MRRTSELLKLFDEEISIKFQSKFKQISIKIQFKFNLNSMSFFSLGFDSEICEEQQWLDKAADIMAARRLLAKEEAHERKRIRKRSKRSEAKRSEAPQL